MKNYIILIRKSDFTDLFKFGYQYINKDNVVEFDGNISSLKENDEIRMKVFQKINPFDYTFTVLLIHLETELNESGEIFIEDVKNIFPLDAEAKREIEISFDQRIRIEDPLWNEYTNAIQERFLFEGAKKGSKNIWNILKIDEPIEKFAAIISDSELKEIVREAYNAKRPSGEFSFWVYLMRYERHAFFPKTTIGYFMDIVNIYINYLQKEEIQAELIERTEIYCTLNSINPKASMKEIIELLSERKEGRNFLDKVIEASSFNSDCDPSIVAILYLIFKNTFIDGFRTDSESEKILDYSKKLYGKETLYSLYLLGLFLGNDHTFECMYDSLPLAIFKQPNLQPENGVIQNDKVTGNCDIKHSTHSATLFDNEKFIERNFPIAMKKKGKGRARTAKNEKQYQKNIEDGYTPV